MIKPWIRKVPKDDGYEVVVPEVDEIVFISEEQYRGVGSDDNNAITFAVQWLSDLFYK